MANLLSRYPDLLKRPSAGSYAVEPVSTVGLLLASSIGLAVSLSSISPAQAIKPHGQNFSRGSIPGNSSSGNTVNSSVNCSGRSVVEQLLQAFEQAGKTGGSGSAGTTSGKQAAADFNNRAAALIDYAKMSERCLGKGPWDSLDSSRKRDFTVTLRGLVEARYYPRWRKIFSSGKVVFLDETAQGGDTLVHTKLTLGKKEETLSWRVTGASPRIVSLAVADKDLLDRLTTRVQAKYRKAGFDSLLSWMQGKLSGSESTPIASARAVSVSSSSSSLSD